MNAEEMSRKLFATASLSELKEARTQLRRWANKGEKIAAAQLVEVEKLITEKQA